MHRYLLYEIRIKVNGGYTGRIRGKFIKNTAKRLVNDYPDKFSLNFSENKKALDELNLIDDKPIRNKIAGYIVSVVEKKKVK